MGNSCWKQNPANIRVISTIKKIRMKSIQSKSLLTLIIIFFIIGFTTSAKSIIDSPEYSTLNTEISTEPTTEINPLSVVYPVSLQGYRMQTKEYIKAFSKKKRE